MAAPDFEKRSGELELMDDPALAPQELERELGHLDLFNRCLGGYANSLSAVARLLPPGCAEFSTLDVGSGGGDTSRRLCAWAASRGLRARVRAVDLSPSATAYARARDGGRTGVEYASEDLFALPEDRPYDVVHAALFLHHCATDEAAARALRKMWALCRVGLVVNDLHRHPLAYYGAKALAACSGSKVTRTDAPLSVLRAFRKSELRALASAAGIPAPEIRWGWAFRWQLVARK